MRGGNGKGDACDLDSRTWMAPTSLLCMPSPVYRTVRLSVETCRNLPKSRVLSSDGHGSASPSPWAAYPVAVLTPAVCEANPAPRLFS